MKAGIIIGAVEDVTKKWAKQRRREERERSAVLNRRQAMTSGSHVSIRDAAWRVMERAYLKASAGGTLPAGARQVMYAARPFIMQIADRNLGKDFDKYFTQGLLPDYIEETGVAWDIVFDARGHFHEPHVELEVPLGTLQVREYLRRIEQATVDAPDFNIIEKHYPTIGPLNRYGGLMFIEKEGFGPLFRKVKLAARHDIAIMSTKGMSVTASRELADILCGIHNIPLLLLHDFDKSGFSIAGTLRRNTRRYTFANKIKVIDLGLRLGDIEGLETEQVMHRGSPSAIKANLRKNGATAEEIEFLLHRRVELNALASDQLVALIERKLAENGIRKVIPDDAVLADAYRRMRRQVLVQEHIDKLLKEIGDDDGSLPVPGDLRSRIEATMRTDRAQPWDAAVLDIAKSDHLRKDGA